MPRNEAYFPYAARGPQKPKSFGVRVTRDAAQRPGSPTSRRLAGVERSIWTFYETDSASLAIRSAASKIAFLPCIVRASM
jgi:hypothetical protein